jgi:predicted ArsR family transcriptional regulator
MTGRAFRERLLESTRGQILSLLRMGSRTVNDLAGALNLTDNAVRVHLVSLERDGLIQREGMQPGVRKPHVSYGLSGDAEQIFPKAYGLLLNQFVTTVSQRLSTPVFEDSLREVGRALAAKFIEPLRGKSRAERVSTALDLLAELGGAAILDESGGEQFIRGNNCPLSAVTANHPKACMIAEALLSEVIGVPVTEHCSYGERPCCCFKIASAGGEGQLG